jgi:voltage-gated potassium channel
LFALLLLFYTVVPMLHHARDALHPAVAVLVEGVLFILLLTWAAAGVCAGRTAMTFAVLVGAALAGLWLGEVFVDGDLLLVLRYVLGTAFFVFVIGMMLRFIFASRRVTLNTVCASLCVYLLLGLVWGLAYSAVDVLSPGAFTWTVTEKPAPILRVGRGDTAVLYFSFATLTTLGYGDIVPTAPLTRMLATVEAVAGQLYLAVLVARLVGLHIAHSLEQGPNTEREAGIGSEGVVKKQEQATSVQPGGDAGS